MGDNDLRNVEIPDEELESMVIEDQPKSEQAATVEDGEAEAAAENQSTETDVEQSGETSANVRESPEAEQSTSIELAEDEELVITTPDGQEYTVGDFLQMQEDLDNAGNWRKSNTEAAQELATKEKALSKVYGDADLMDALDDYFDGSNNNPLRNMKPEPSESQSDTVVEFANQAPESSDLLQVQTRLEQLEQKEIDRKVELEVSQLVKSYPELDDQKELSKVIKHALDINANLEVAYRDLNFSKVAGELNSVKSKPKAKKAIPTASGTAKGAKATEYQKIASDYDEAAQRALEDYIGG